ncbi:hypothetical protein QPK31_23365 [Massilia sp. YIM B02769]|uniref:hypothetical protein n=1 Tax=Massilia sp. YIM B02769 TaxID=3050129 RepID=UPI0025B696FA|nr:hypothetical protein [Massilia sp. YIM B02769]MDN4061163.1 hypothetical protein [Massilia sp. YIM B02769]
MARARNIKPGFFTNEELVELPFSTRLLFIGLWTLADREGRMEDKPKRIKMNLFPADDINVDEALCELQASGFLKRYEIDGARYIQVLAFRKHQNPHRDEKASSIPAMDGHGASTVQAPCEHGGNPADSPIPDSPIPDTSTGYSAATQPELREDEQNARPDPAPATLLSIEFNAAGIRTQPADPRLLTLAEQGVTPQTVAAACAEARAAKPNESIGLGYVLAILTRWAADAAKVQAGGAAQPRASPGYQTANDKAKAWADSLTGKNRSHEPDHRTIIDLNDAPARKLG